MGPKPGPTFAIAEADADIHVKKSEPPNDSNNADIENVNIYKKKKLITDS